MANNKFNTMGDPKITIWEELSQGFSKALIWLSYISIGVMAKLAFDSRLHTLTKKQIIIKTVLSVFVGYIAAVICETAHYTSWIKIVAPVSTLLGESIVVYTMTNWRQWANDFLPKWFRPKIKDTNKK